MWAYVVIPSVMQHGVLLGRGSWVCFNNRSFRAMPPRPSDNRILASLSYLTTPRQACELIPQTPLLRVEVSTFVTMAS